MRKPDRFTKNTSSFAHYWNNGTGKQLLKKMDNIPSLAEAEDYLPYLFRWDKSGDQVAIDLYLKKGFVKGNESLQAYLQKTNKNTTDNKIWGIFFSSFSLEPSWLNKEKLNIGSEFCRRAGLAALIVLRDYCLMGGYESAAINKPLVYTGALKKSAVKRLTETVEFWVQITKKNGLNYGEEGFKQIFMTRIIHSYSRINILQHTDWETSKWGIPINSWDMQATNLGFSLVFINGLRLMGVQASPAEIEGVLHFWKYIGYLLGIPTDLLPDTEEQAIRALYLWTMTQPDADEDSRALAKSLKEEPVLAQYPKNPLYRKMMREVHLFYNRYLLGDFTCQKLNLPSTTIGRFGIVNVWRTKKQEAKIVDETSRQKAIQDGGDEQERVRQIYQEFNS